VRRGPRCAGFWGAGSKAADIGSLSRDLGRSGRVQPRASLDLRRPDLPFAPYLRRRACAPWTSITAPSRTRASGASAASKLTPIARECSTGSPRAKRLARERGRAQRHVAASGAAVVRDAHAHVTSPPVLVQPRHAMSLMRGPMTRVEIRAARGAA